MRPADGALIRRWWRCWYDVPERLQHTEDRYEIIVDDSAHFVIAQLFNLLDLMRGPEAVKEVHERNPGLQ